jgi:hypothetical protein
VPRYEDDRDLDIRSRELCDGAGRLDSFRGE